MPKYKKGAQVALKYNRHLYGFTELEAGTVVSVVNYLGGGQYAVEYEVDEGCHWSFGVPADELVEA